MSESTNPNSNPSSNTNTNSDNQYQNPQRLGFQSEIKELLKLVTHSLYSNREIFLRELISNASDAADKLRFAAVSQPELYQGDSELKIKISFDKDQKTITVSDNGIGMTREELINNLGTIAKSGTREFLASLTEQQSKDSAMIGQFGVGFYSAFVVASRVKVISRKAGTDDAQRAAVWESDGSGEFTVADTDKVTRGTDIILTLKEQDTDLLDYWKLKDIITKYSDHIMLPIIMLKAKESKEQKDAAEQTDNAVVSNNSQTPEFEEETVNRAIALWTLPKNEISDEQYQEFYKHISHDWDNPLIWSHNRVEGKLEYTTLLYIPKHAPFDFWQRERTRGLKLYVQRVFIMDESEQLLPNYLRFVKGIVDAKDLPLNVSRELLQDNRIIKQIRAGVIKRVIDMLTKLAKEQPEEYQNFWKEFGMALKEGLVEDHANQDKLAELLRFHSTQENAEQATVTLADYRERMLPEQEKIYYLTAESYTNAKNSPYLESFRQHDVEVLLLTDRIDEWWLTHYRKYQDKEFQLITQGEIDLSKFSKGSHGGHTDQTSDQGDDAQTSGADGVQSDSATTVSAEQQAKLDQLLERIKTLLGEQVSNVKFSKRLVDSPVCITTADNELSFSMHRMMSAFGQNMPKVKPVLELNPEHPLVQQLVEITDDEQLTNWAKFLLEEATLLAGEKLEDVADFTKRINQLLQK